MYMCYRWAPQLPRHSTLEDPASSTTESVPITLVLEQRQRAPQDVRFTSQWRLTHQGATSVVLTAIDTMLAIGWTAEACNLIRKHYSCCDVWTFPCPTMPITFADYPAGSGRIVEARRTSGRLPTRHRYATLGISVRRLGTDYPQFPYHAKTTQVDAWSRRSVLCSL